MPCDHETTLCLNQFELIRKYRCTACHAVMMCSCDESIGRKHLSHQLDRGVVLETQERVPVTAGFQPNICRECRGLTPEAHPVASIPGRTSKIKRYYWRELAFREMELYEEWKGTPEGQASRAGSHFEVPQLAEQASAEIKHLHATAPRYVFAGMSQQQALELFQVEVLNLTADYVEGGTGRAQILAEGEPMGVEAYAVHELGKLGYRAIVCESRPFHSLFATLLGRLIQDPTDPKLRMVGVADRTAPSGSTRPVWWLHPDDFGTPGYGVRRQEAIEAYLVQVLPDTSEGLKLFFEECFEETNRLRTYLWAEADEAVETAKLLFSILPPPTIKAILRYLVSSYWANYTGWPDLIAEREQDWFFAEVKSSHDKLSDDQKHWIEQNASLLHLPFKLIKIHRGRAAS